MATAEDLLARAAGDGHTWLPAGLVASVLVGSGTAADADAARATVRAAVDSGTIVLLDGPGHPLALPDLVAAEEAIAEAVTGLAAVGSVTVLDAGPGAGVLDRVREALAAASSALVTAATPDAARRLSAALGVPVVDAVDATPGPDTDLLVVVAAEALDVRVAGTLLAAVPEEAAVLVVGDTGGVPAGPGRVLGDLVEAAAGVGATVQAVAGGGSPIGRLCAAIRAGDLPAVDDPTRAVVVVPARDAEHAAHRAGQLVRDSIPRVLGIAASDVAVLSPVRRGPAGVDALVAAGLPATGVPVGRRWPAVVAVLPPEACGLLSRPVVYALFAAAGKHLSVVHAAGPALAGAVATVPGRPRRTRLATLLREAAGL